MWKAFLRRALPGSDSTHPRPQAASTPPAANEYQPGNHDAAITPANARLHGGRGHLLLSRTPSPAFQLAAQLIQEKVFVVVVTRFHPERVSSEHGIPRNVIIWLTTNPGADHLTPSKPALVGDSLCRTISENSKGVLVIHGFEYLTTTNDFPTALRVIEQLAEKASATGGRFVLTLDPRTLPERELALIEAFLDTIEEPAG